MPKVLGFNPENVTPVLELNLKLLSEANTVLTTRDLETTLSMGEIIETFDIARLVVLSHITPEEITLNRGGTRTLYTGNKYRKDKELRNYWKDVISEVEEAIDLYFTREIKLSTGVKLSVHPAARRVMKLSVLPALLEFTKHTPKQILAVLDSVNEGVHGQDIFGYMSRYLLTVAANIHPDNVQVARMMVQRKCNSQAKKWSRLALIRNVTEKAQQDKYR